MVDPVEPGIAAPTVGRVVQQALRSANDEVVIVGEDPRVLGLQALVAALESDDLGEDMEGKMLADEHVGQQ